MGRTAIHPGEHLAEQLEELGMSAAELARQLRVPTNRITAILNGQRAVTGDTALRLGHFFGTSAEFWMNLQKLYELRIAEQETGKTIEGLPTLAKSVNKGRLQSHSERNSSHKRTISLGDTAFLSLVCAAGIKYSSGKRLSRIIACRNRQRPSITSTISYTIRFSSPRTTSRFLKPISASIHTTFPPPAAKAVARFAVMVVLPTPPLPEVTVTTFAVI